MNPKDLALHRFWGKARPYAPDFGPAWHPLVYHSLDVAAVGETLLTKHRGLGESIGRLLGWPHQQMAQLICFLLSLHDIGKFAKKFQAKAPDLYPDCFGDDPASFPQRYDHGAGGMRLFDAGPDAFSLPGGVGHRVWRPLMSAVTGHHGEPPHARLGENLITLRSDFGRAGIEAAHRFILHAFTLFPLPSDLPAPRRRKWRRASHAVAGLAVLADWIGSNQKWFRYCEPVQDLDTYWDVAQARAEHAVAEAGVLPAPVGARLRYPDLIGGDVSPSPMQKWAETTDLPVGPALFMIEDETGSGKTEAALMLAHRLMRSGRADGLYVALPTMATANAMFDRFAAAHRRLFAANARPSIALAHGASGLHEGFQDAIVQGGLSAVPDSNEKESHDDSGSTASAACAAWIADDRRRTFLADVGAGTIDQALLSVLPNRHQSLRLLGLMRRVLILDEVHAYDAYMRREMEVLLEFQAGLGGSAILLSATLPLSTRERLANAFSKGLGRELGGGGASQAYPLATVCAADAHSAAAVPGQTGRARSLPVRFLRSTDDALREIEYAAGAGNAVLYIRNTVDDAFDAYAALKARGLDPDLFHARFALVDRLEIERNIVRTFGKHSTGVERAGKVLVATQVVEQSLDLDFDVLITDLAPIDLLIQRAGRLWRHQRKERAGRPELVVVGPKPAADADEEWFKRAFPRASYVYQDHARLWLTSRTLEDAGFIESPGRMRALIEAVYGDDADANLPADLQAC
ncbi:MAG: CRISPR-associated helicase Cas3', partial [Candidatus Aminicenantes bacterium]|nr:CRISPR-associated helicase Cas3' [Candidatus Aminicenantes bacterium]